MAGRDQLDADERIKTVTDYREDGFVPNSYKWPAPGTRKVWHRDGRVESEPYDRKRSGGVGPYLVAKSAKGGVIKPKSK